MELVGGPTMLDDIDTHPWRSGAHIRTLAELQRQLASLEAPAWLATDSRIPAGSSILHLDLHPMNVIMSATGPVVIDWTNARRGHPDFDAAVTYLLAASFEPSGWKEALGVRLMVHRFARHRGAASVDRWWSEAIDYRSADPNVTAAEAAKLETLRSGRPGRRLRT